MSIYNHPWLAFFCFAFQCRDPVLIRYMLCLKLRNTFMKFQIFRLECLHIVTDLRIRRLELCRDYPWAFHLLFPFG